jgi:hypothetical protein
MVKGIRFMLGGCAAAAAGGSMFALPAEVGISWYEPVGVCLAGVLLIAVGLYTIGRSK